MKLARWDPFVFYEFRTVFISQGPLVPEDELTDAIEAVERCWPLVYAINIDVPFEVGRFYFAIAMYPQALRWFQRSLRLFDAHPITEYNIGLSLYGLGKLEQAEVWLRRSDAQGYPAAKAWLARLAK